MKPDMARGLRLRQNGSNSAELSTGGGRERRRRDAETARYPELHHRRCWAEIPLSEVRPSSGSRQRRCNTSNHCKNPGAYKIGHRAQPRIGVHAVNQEWPLENRRQDISVFKRFEHFAQDG